MPAMRLNVQSKGAATASQACSQVKVHMWRRHQGKARSTDSLWYIEHTLELQLAFNAEVLDCKVVLPVV